MYNLAMGMPTIELGLFVVFFILGALALEANYQGWTFIVGVCLVVLGLHLTQSVVWPLSLERMVHGLVWGAIYLLVGAIWAALSWIYSLVIYKRVFERVKRDYLLKTGESKLPIERTEGENFRIYVHSLGLPWDTAHAICSFKLPKLKHNKDQLVTWAVYWPLSVVGFTLRKVSQRLWKACQRAYDDLVRRIFKDAEELR